MFTFPSAALGKNWQALTGTVFAAGTNGAVISSTNGGVSFADKTVGSGYDGALNGVAVGNSTIVAYGIHGYLLKSTNTTAWTTCPIAVDDKVTALVYDSTNTRWVAAVRDKIYTTSDLVTWTYRATIVAFSDILGLAVNGGTLVAVGAGGLVATSANGGVAWTLRTFDTLTAGTRMNSVVFANSTFVAVGTGGAIQSSANGTTWTKRTSGTAQELTSIAYHSSTWVAGGVNRTIITSSALTTWNAISVGVGSGTDTIQTLYSDGTTLVGTSLNSSGIYKSTDTSTWTAVSMGSNYSGNRGAAIFQSVIYDSTNSKWVGIGATYGGAAFDNNHLKTVIFTATNLAAGSPWTDITNIGGRSYKTYHSFARDLVTGNIFMAGVGTLDVCYTSNGGTSWTVANLKTINSTLFDGSAPISGLWYGSSKYMVALASAGIYSSSNLTTWSKVGDIAALGGGSAQFHPYKVGGFINSKWVIPTKGGGIMSSPDGVTWTYKQVTGDSTDVYQVVFGNGVYVLTSANGKLYSSTDLLTWTLRATSNGTTSSFFHVYYSGAWFFAYTSSGEVHRSADGVSWTVVSTIPAGIVEIKTEYDFAVSTNGGKVGIMPSQTGLQRTADHIAFKPMVQELVSASSASGVQWIAVEIIPT